MPRKRRFFLPDVPVHVVQRGNNRQAVFFDDNDYRVYLDWLGEAAAAHGCAIHAYVLMTNHIHLLMTPADGHGISATLQAIGRRFVPYINHCYGRTGTLWEGAFGPVRSRRRATCWSATATSSSIPCGQGWWICPLPILGRATGPTPWESPAPWYLRILPTWHSAPTGPSARQRTASCLPCTSARKCSATSGLAFRVELRSGTTASGYKSSRHLALRSDTAHGGGRKAPRSYPLRTWIRPSWTSKGV